MTRTLLALALTLATPIHAQEPMHSHAAAPRRAAADSVRHGGMDMSMPGMQHGHDHAMPMAHAMAGEAGPMRGIFGDHPGTREASGTAWQPDLAPHMGRHVMRGPWLLMLHGMADVVDDHQGGPRGAHDTFASNMIMVTARRPWSHGRLGGRAMLSLEPATIGQDGYPLLLQTGETADGRTPLVDRQHPHDLFMELALVGSVVSGDRSGFLYARTPNNWSRG